MLFIQFNWILSHKDKVWGLYDLLLKKSKVNKYKLFIFILFITFIFIKKSLEKYFMDFTKILSSTNFNIEKKYSQNLRKMNSAKLLKIQLCITGINYILKYIQIENNYFKW